MRHLRLALAGDTMLGRLVGERLARAPVASLIAPDLVDLVRDADVFVCNLECCISERGEPWPDPAKPFFFRAPPAAVEFLALLGVDCVTLANNHALDFGRVALLDTLDHLRDAGIEWAGAGPDLARARAPVTLDAPAYRLRVLGVTDHPADFEAGPDLPGVAFADLRRGTPPWLLEAVHRAASPADTAPPDGVLVTPHWGPNMVPAPLPYVRRAARDLRAAGATLVAGHSAHVFHGVGDAVVYDLGDFLDDYATDPVLRNDLGLLWFVDLDECGPRRLEAVPLALDFCHTRLARPDEAALVARRFREACAELGTDVRLDGQRLVITWR